ncbi:MAG: ECF transporter S component [Oscillospiraceae bacterium]|nr:ECF transporter S component [Oscillospiraceae bacterium]
MKPKVPVRTLTVLAVLSALAYLSMFFIKIPVVLFLSYEPKDVFIALAGFFYGPVPAFAVSLVVSFVEMITVSATGWIGFTMNVVSSSAFVCTAAVIYKKKHDIKGALIGLMSGVLVATVVMLLWNYFLTPIFMGIPRAAVAELLLPAFLPFNLVKYGLNAAVTMLIYKPVVSALRSSRLLPASENKEAPKGKLNKGVLLLSAFVLITCVLLILVLQGRI